MVDKLDLNEPVWTVLKRHLRKGQIGKVLPSNANSRDQVDESKNTSDDNCSISPVIVLVTVNDYETHTLLDAFVGTGRTPQQETKEGVTYNVLGTHGGCLLIHTICEMGAHGIGASQQRTRQAIDHWEPKAVIAIGIAFGMDETKQKIGDVLISTQIQDYELGRMNKNGTLTPRGDKPGSADTLRNRFRQTDATERRRAKDWPTLRFGLVLSGQKLIDNLDYRETLKTLFPGAIGGEMEATGLYVSADAAKVDWIVVKGICDWGHAKDRVEKEAWQKLAARNAARVFKAALDVGGWYGGCPTVPSKPAHQGPAVASRGLPPPTTVPALHQIPPPPHDFAGRAEDLTKLLKMFKHGGMTISGLQGMGGVGKTTLALKLAEKLTPQYPDAQIYLDLKGVSPSPLSTSEAMAHVICAWHPDAKIPTEENELRATYTSVLYGRRALLLMDNAASKAQVEPLIPPSSCAMLVTSRNHFTLPGLVPWILETLRPADARSLLIAIAPRLSGHAETLAKLCGYLPLALRLAASALAERNDLSPEDYLRSLRDALKRLALVDASLGMSYELLAPRLQECWTKLAVFPESFNARAAEAVLGLNCEEAKIVLGDLTAFSMLEWNARNARYKLHDLARLFADRRLTSSHRNESQLRHSEYFKTLLTKANELYLRGARMTKRGVALFDSEWVNIQAGFAWAKEHATKNANAAELCFAYPDIGVFLLDLRQSPHQTISWLNAALEVAKRLKKRDQEGLILSYLGNASAASGDFEEAAALCKRALRILKLVGDYKQAAYALSNLGWCYTELRHVSESIQVQTQALKVFTRLGDDRAIGTALGRLGRAYTAKGQHRKNIELQTQYLDFARRIGNRRGAGYAQGQLGTSYAALGNFRLAAKFYRRHLQIARDIGDLRGEADALFDIGQALFALGKVSDAISHAEHAMRVLKSIKHQKSAEVKMQLTKWRCIEANKRCKNPNLL